MCRSGYRCVAVIPNPGLGWKLLVGVDAMVPEQVAQPGNFGHEAGEVLAGHVDHLLVVGGVRVGPGLLLGEDDHPPGRIGEAFEHGLIVAGGGLRST